LIGPFEGIEWAVGGVDFFVFVVDLEVVVVVVDVVVVVSPRTRVVVVLGVIAYTKFRKILFKFFIKHLKKRIPFFVIF